MKVLLATPELNPLTGSSSFGTTVRNVAEEIQACIDIDFAVALPATQTLVDQLAEDVLTDTAPTGVPGGRIYSIEMSDGPAIYLLDHAELRPGFTLDTSEADLANRLTLWSSLLLDLLVRLRPSIHVAHAFGWETALLPTLIRAHRLPVATAFSNPAIRGCGPSLSLIQEAAHRRGDTKLLTAFDDDFAERPVLDRALVDADATDALESFSPSPEEGDLSEKNAPLSNRQLARIHLAKRCGLDDAFEKPLFVIPTGSPEILLPILSRLLETGAQIILETPRQPARIEAVLIDGAHHHSRVFARTQPTQETGTEALERFDGADFLLLLPVDTVNPPHHYAPARAKDFGITPILPAGAASTVEGALTYRGEDPEAIWSALKSAIALRRCPDRWHDHLKRLLRARNSTGGLSPRLATLYRDAIKPALIFP